MREGGQQALRQRWLLGPKTSPRNCGWKLWKLSRGCRCSQLVGMKLCTSYLRLSRFSCAPVTKLRKLLPYTVLSCSDDELWSQECNGHDFMTPDKTIWSHDM